MHGGNGHLSEDWGNGNSRVTSMCGKRVNGHHVYSWDNYVRLCSDEPDVGYEDAIKCPDCFFLLKLKVISNE